MIPMVMHLSIQQKYCRHFLFMNKMKATLKWVGKCLIMRNKTWILNLEMSLNKLEAYFLNEHEAR